MWLHWDSLPGRAGEVHQRAGRLGDQSAPHGSASERPGRVPVWQAHPGQRKQLNESTAILQMLSIFVSCLQSVFYDAICMVLASHCNYFIQTSCHLLNIKVTWLIPELKAIPSKAHSCILYVSALPTSLLHICCVLCRKQLIKPNKMNPLDSDYVSCVVVFNGKIKDL